MTTRDARRDLRRRRPPGSGRVSLVAALFAMGALLAPACDGGEESADPERAEPRKATSATLPGSTPKEPGAFLGPVHTIEANGIRIGYRQFGRGRPLLLLMGQTGTMSLWEVGLMRKLADAGFRVTMFDNRGMGYTTDDRTEPLTLRLMADDTLALIDALGLDEPTLVGWSMGGEISLTLAARHGDAVGTILTCGSTAGSSNEVDGSPDVYAELADPNLPPEKLLGLIFPATAQDAIAAFVESIQLYPPEETAPESITRQAEAEESFSEDASLWDALPSFTNKVVLTNGSEDVVALPENAHLIGARIPNAVVDIFTGAGHAALMQDPDRFVALVKTHS